MKIHHVHQLILVLACLALGITNGWAQTDPYVDWEFDFEKANKAQDGAKLEELVSKNPDFARVWFYGFVYDVVTTGVPAAEQADIRRKCQQIAGALKSLGQDHGDAQRVMDTLSQDGTQAKIESLRVTEERWLNGVGDSAMLPLQLSVIHDPDQASQIFYRALFKATKWKNKLGGTDKQRTYLDIARYIASGFALAFGEDRWWRALAAYQGAVTVPLSRVSFIDETVGQALNGSLALKPAAAYQNFSAAFNTVSKSRQDSLLVALMMNGFAHTASRNGDFAQAIALRMQLLSGLRPLRLSQFIEVIHVQLLGDYLASSQLVQALRSTEQLEKTMAPSPLRARTVSMLRAAADAFAQESLRLWEAKKPADTLRFIGGAIGLYDRLAAPEFLSAQFLNENVAAALLEIQKLQANLNVRLGAAYEVRGEFASARSALEVAQKLYEGPLADLKSSRELELLKIDDVIEQGEFSAAEKALDAFRTTENLEPYLLAASHGLSARQFRLSGAYAPSFAHANEGLRVLHAAKSEEKSLYGTLHREAALSLGGAGFASAELERWRTFSKFNVDFGASVQFARSLAYAGEVTEAVSQLEPHFDSENARKTTILQGCFLASTDRLEEAKASLNVLVPQLSLSTSRRYQSAGYACLAHIAIRQKNWNESVKLADAALRSLRRFPTENLEWRIHGLKAQGLSRLGRRGQAAESFATAFQNLEAVHFGEPSFGAAYFDFVAGPHISLPALYKDAAHNAFELAQRKSGSERDESLRNALRWTKMSRSLETRPTAYPYQRLQDELEGVSALRRALTRRASLARRLENSILSERRLADLNRDYLSVSAQVQELVEQRIESSVSSVHPFQRHLKKCENETVCVHYLVGLEKSWAVLVDGTQIRSYALPGQRQLESVGEKIDALLAVAPAAVKAQARGRFTDPNYGTWKRLYDHGKTVLPFLYDGDAQSLAGRSIQLHLDGSLLHVNFDALVVKLPAKRQAVTRPESPEFFGTHFKVSYLWETAGRSAEVKGKSTYVYSNQVLKLCEGDTGGNCVSSGDAELIRGLTANISDGRKVEFAKLKNDERTVGPLVLSVPLAIASTSVSADGNAVSLDKLPVAGEMVSLLTYWDPKSAVAAQDFSKFWIQLAAKDVTGIVMLRNSARSANQELPQWLLTSLETNGSSLLSLFEWMVEQSASTIDVTQGGQPLYHPHFWARWQRFGQPATMQRVAATSTEKATDNTENTSSPKAAPAVETQDNPEPKAVEPATPPAAPSTPDVEDPFADDPN